MIRLTYISTAQTTPDDKAIADLLEASRRRNRLVGLTGLLLFDGVRFLQSLEGEAEPLLALFARIRKDPRHRACVELSRVEIAARGFDGWDMAWQRAEGPQRRESLVQAVDRFVAQVADPNIRGLFTGFARIDRRAA